MAVISVTERPLFRRNLWRNESRPLFLFFRGLLSDQPTRPESSISGEEPVAIESKSVRLDKRVIDWMDLWLRGNWAAAEAKAESMSAISSSLMISCGTLVAVVVEKGGDRVGDFVILWSSQRGMMDMTVGIATNTGGTVVFAIRRDSVACKSIDCFGTSELRC